MKKLLLTLALVMACFANSYAYDACVDGIYYNLNSDAKTAEVTFRESSSNNNYYNGSVVIPEKIIYNNVEYSVTSIEHAAFADCSNLISITIPNSITNIGGEAFSCCGSLTSVNIDDLAAWCKIQFFNETSNPLYYAHRLYLNGEEITYLAIPNSVNNISMLAFCGCTGLIFVTIPNSVTNIGSGAFQQCSSLTTINIPNSVTSIEGYAFSRCTGLTSIDIPNSVTSIGEYAFEDCSGLTSIDIPNSVTSIGEHAFNGCFGLTSVNIQDLSAWLNIKFKYSAANPLCYAHRLYLNGEEIKDLIIPNSVTSIGEWAFEDCEDLTSVEIPNSVTSIGSRAFYECSSIVSINIPNSVTSIGSSAFYECSGITSINIPNTVTSIENGAFWNCSGLTSIYVSWSRPLSIAQYTFDGVDKSNCTLYIPKGTFSMYASAPYWMDFQKIVEYDPEGQDIYLTTEHNGIQVSKQKLNSDNPLEIYVPEGYTKVTFNGTDVTSQISDGKYVTPSITESSTISIYVGGGSEDINGDGNVDSQDVLKIYDYMKNH